MQIILENDTLTAGINLFGAELASLVKKETKEEYMWNADEKFWKRHSPVLFPIVGGLKDKQYSYDGKTYTMGQHGFARDMEFSVVSEKEDEVWFSLSADEQTYEKYPFNFTLEIGYRLEKNTLQVIWRVINEDDKVMHFSIGGHPAFMCPIAGRGSQTDYYLGFDTDKDLTYSKLSADGLLEQTGNVLATNGGMMKIDEHLFDEDALVIEGEQAHEVSLCDAEKKPYLTVSFDAPLFGLWSPAKKNAPFICIEPWYGRCDAVDFAGTLQEREYGHSIEPNEQFEVSYQIKVC